MTDKFTGGGLDSLTKAAYEAGYEDGAAAEREACMQIAHPGERPSRCCNDCQLIHQIKTEIHNSIRARGEQK